MSPKLLRPLMVKYGFRTLILPPKPSEPNVKIVRDTFVPELRFKYNPLKYYMSKMKMWKLRWTWDHEFRERDFMEESKEKAIQLTEMVRSRDPSQLSKEFAKSNAYYQVINEAINFPHESCAELLRFRKKDIRRALPIQVQLQSILGFRYAVIDVVMVGLRQIGDFESEVDLCKVKEALLEMDPDLKNQLDKPMSQLPYVFIELFIRFRRNYTNTEKIPANQWLVSVYKVFVNGMSKWTKGKLTKSLAELNACKGLLKKLMSTTYKKLAWIFYEPVDAQVLGLEDYHEIVREPMDLTTIKHRLDADFYKNAQEFAKDVRLIFFNAYLYTEPNHLCYQMAKELQSIFEKMFTQLLNNSSELIDKVANDSEDDEEEAIKADDEEEEEEDDDLSDISSIGSQLPEVIEEDILPPPFEGDGEPFTAEEDLDLHAKIQQLDGENLLKVIHLIQQLEDTTHSNKELEFDVATLKTHTKRSIEHFMSSKGITGRRRTCVKTKYQN